MSTPHDEPTPDATPEPITPENITPEQRDALAPVWNAELESMMVKVRKAFTPRVKAAAHAQDGDELKRLRIEAKNWQALLAKWNDGLGHRASANLRDLQESFGDLADDILAALNGELPGQGDGEEWKRGEEP